MIPLLGIDPGFTGALALLDGESGRLIEMHDMPMEGKEMDLARLTELVHKWSTTFPDLKAGLEWPTTRPGEGAERSERFGRGKGYLEAVLFCYQVDYQKIAPNLWTGRLGIPGKTHADSNKLAALMAETYYPDWTHEWTGPRGGINRGRVDALLIAHWMRSKLVAGIRSIVEQHGKGSPAALMLALGCRRPKKGL